MKNLLTILALMMGTTVALNAQTDCNGNNSLCYDAGYEDGQTACTLVVSAQAQEILDLQEQVALLEAAVQLKADSLQGFYALTNDLEDQIDDLEDALDESENLVDYWMDAYLSCNNDGPVDCSSLEAEVETLQAELAECDSVAQAEVEYWMENYNDAVTDCNVLVDSLQAQISAVPAIIQNVVDPLNAEIDALEDALASAQECCSSCPAAIETAVNNAIAECEENNAGELLEVYYNGYEAGLEDCEGEVSGLVDIDGNVINVIGYYNELGQVIDPRTATGVIIRKHDDGTFSKYIQRLQ